MAVVALGGSSPLRSLSFCSSVAAAHNGKTIAVSYLENVPKKLKKECVTDFIFGRAPTETIVAVAPDAALPTVERQL